MLVAGVNFYGLVFVNAFGHIGPYLLHGLEYNPGFLTSVVLFLPATYFTAKALLEGDYCSWRVLLRGLMVGGLCHIILLFSFVSLGKGFISEWFACFLQVVNILPMALIS